MSDLTEMANELRASKQTKEHKGYVILAMQDFEYDQATALA